MKGTIKSNEEIERLFHSGRRSSSYLMTVLASPSSEGVGRCAFIAGKKMGSAPLRSRCKRVLRETARELGAPWGSWDVVFVARGKLAHASHGRVVSCMERCLGELSIR